ncbi:hypothetical protein R6Q59_013648 [Mikania micrantha]
MNEWNGRGNGMDVGKKWIITIPLSCLVTYGSSNCLSHGSAHESSYGSSHGSGHGSGHELGYGSDNGFGHDSGNGFGHWSGNGFEHGSGDWLEPRGDGYGSNGKDLGRGYRIPWLIWIQLLAMFLLIILLCYFTTTSSDLSTPSDSPSATVVSFSSRSFLTSDTRHNSKIRENEIKEIGTSTSEVLQRAKKPDGRPRAESSTTNESSGMIFEHSHHPCNFFGFAKQIFFKCLGIYSNPEKDD